MAQGLEFVYYRTPSLEYLLNKLNRLQEWRAFGAHLPGIDRSLLDSIEEQQRGDVARCKRALLSTWLKIFKGMWSDVMDALCKAGEFRLFTEIQQSLSAATSPQPVDNPDARGTFSGPYVGDTSPRPSQYSHDHSPHPLGERYSGSTHISNPHSQVGQHRNPSSHVSPESVRNVGYTPSMSHLSIASSSRDQSRDPSPLSHDQQPLSHDRPLWSPDQHGRPQSHDQQPLSHDRPQWSHDQQPFSHDRPRSHDQQPLSHDRPQWSYDQQPLSRDRPSSQDQLVPSINQSPLSLVPIPPQFGPQSAIKGVYGPQSSFGSSVPPDQKIMVQKSDTVARNILPLCKAFVRLTVQIRERFVKYVEEETSEAKQREKIKKIARVAEERLGFGVIGGSLTEYESVDKLFEALQPHYYFLNFELLETLVDVLLPDNGELADKIEKYGEEVDEFMESHSLDQLKKEIDNALGHCPGQDISSVTTCRLVIHLKGNWKDIAVKGFDLLLYYLFRTERQLLNHIKITTGSIIVMFLVPVCQAEKFMSITGQKLEFLELAGVFRLYVCTEASSVLDIDENHNYTFASALLHAVCVANTDAAKLLAKVATDLNFNKGLSVIKPGSTPLMVASCNGLTEIAEVLLEAGADPQMGRSGDNVNPLLLAAQNGHSQIVELLCKKEIDLNVVYQDGRTPLIFATQGNHIEVVKCLLRCHANPNMVDTYGASALTIACRYGYAKVAALLLRGGADPNQRNQSRETPLMLAGQCGLTPVVKLLLDNGAQPDDVIENGSTALMVACQNGHSGVAKLLLERGADPDRRESEGWTAMMFAGQKRHCDIIRLLVSHHASTHLVERRTGACSLMMACKNGYQDVVSTLLDLGADRDTVDDTGRTPLMAACMLQYNDIAKLLIQRGADPDHRVEGIDAFLWATVVGNLEMVKHFVQVTQPRLQAGLIKACLYGHVEMIKFIVESLPDQNQDLVDFMYACIDGDVSQVLNFISTFPAFNVDTTFLHDVTPLMLAASCGHIDLVDILLDSNASIEDRDVCGNDAYDYAEAGGHDEIAAYIAQRYNEQQ